ncbi:MAG: hypothetical protein NZM26_02725 [Patescibacteria group bacterium]|nr:hypothetical protein [Patescibacteria group bacterium]
MVKPLIEDPEIVATTTCYYHYDRNFSLMDRYFALFGTSEPLPFYLNKADRMMWGEKKWTLLGSAFDKGDYFKVRFEKDPRKVPSIGTNGTLMRTAIIKKHAKSDPDNHYPIDVMVDVVMKGYVYYGFVKTSIIHLTHSKGIWQFLKRRKRFVEHYHFEDNKKRRWSVVMKGDWPKVLLYVFYSITFVVPFLHSIKGYLKVRDIAWFVHPFMCFGTTAIYTWVTIVYFLKSLNKK